MTLSFFSLIPLFLMIETNMHLQVDTERDILKVMTNG
jgi:hypothetical protein